MVEKTTTNTKFWKMKNSGRRLVTDSAQHRIQKAKWQKMRRIQDNLHNETSGWST